ncbi:MAG: hypothetical protein LBJ94_00975 [Puniceicoccales bacterium]|nr:hypothetical protein [Puniceicoccales bacterium]
MKEFVDLFQKLARDKESAKEAQKSLSLIAQIVGQARKWLDKIPEETVSNAFAGAATQAREKLANMVRDGTIDEKYLERVHRARMRFPNDITRTLENITKAYYEEYKGEAKKK